MRVFDVTDRPKRLAHALLWLAALAVTFSCLWLLENERLSVWQDRIETEAGPVEIYQRTSGSDGPLVFVAHGFAGSHQMMQYLSRDLARSGYLVAAFDFLGHGRNTELLSPDVARIEGTTLQLVEQTQKVISAVRAEFPLAGREVGLVGHSMATDIIIRTAADIKGAKSVVAISMYSDVVTATFPQHLLILSGQWEDRLRAVGMRLAAQVDAQAAEGETVFSGPVSRRTVAVPYTEHVAVLYSAVTQQETRDWFNRTLASSGQNTLPAKGQGLALLGALGGLVALFILSVGLLNTKGEERPRLPVRRFVSTILLPAVCAAGAAAVGPANVLGMSAFGSLVWFLSIWGAVQLVCIGRSNLDLAPPRVIGCVVLLLGGALVAFALDRYAAAFVPTGIRLSLLALLLPATLLFACADAMSLQSEPLFRRIVARSAALAVLGICMATMGRFGLLFTIVPVLGLFYIVYGPMGRAIAQRFGPLTAGLGLGVILAWSIAASTPIFAI